MSFAKPVSFMASAVPGLQYQFAGDRLFHCMRRDYTVARMSLRQSLRSRSDEFAKRFRLTTTSQIWPPADSEPDYLMFVRGCAVVGVALGHVFTIGGGSLGAFVSKGPYGFRFHTEHYEWWRSLLEIVTPILGLNFVVLFFVQSGYLMGKVFFDERYHAPAGVGSFYLARFLRLAPLLYFNLLFCLAFFPYVEFDTKKIVGDFLFITNFTGLGINGVTWSLSHEMQYYLVCPFLFLALRKPTLTSLLLAVAAVVVLFELPQYVHSLAPFKFLYAFVAGFTVNLALKHIAPTLTHAQKHIGLVLGLLIVHLGFNVVFFYGREDEAIAVAVLGSALLIAVCEVKVANEHDPAPIAIRVGVLLGFLTYGFYLWHYVILRMCAPAIASVANTLVEVVSGPFWLAMAIYHFIEIIVIAVLSLGAAFLSYEFIETKFRPSLYSGLRRRA
jgi:peptidoglycan/LPS O-acetylase OafA/YrhL